jgi:hypothetical protein
MSSEVPEAGIGYRISSKATGFEIVGRDDPEPAHTVWAADLHSGVWEDGFWLFEGADVGYRLRHASAGLMLDSNPDRQVYLHFSNDGSYQKWRMNADDEGYWSLVNLATGFALDGNADHDIYTQTPNDGAYQRWRFIRAPGV